MPLVLADRVKETTTTVGTGAVTLGGAATGFQSFAVIGNGNTTYYTIAGQGTSEWEVGIGTYTASGTTLSRDTVLASSAGAPNKTSFSSGTKDVFVTYTAARSVNVDGSALDTFGMGATQGDILYSDATDSFVRLAKNTTATRYLANTGSSNNPQWDQVNLANGVTGTLPVGNGGTGQTTALIPSGTAMLFYQAAAPTGWTQITTQNNKALRVVSGTGGGTGGSVAFTTAFASQAVSGTIANTTATNQGTTLSEAQLPGHTHGAGTFAISTTTTLTGNVGIRAVGSTNGTTGVFTGSSGGLLYVNGGSYGTTQTTMNANHNHTLSGSSGSTGSGSSHTHTQDAHNHTFTGTAINLAVQYIDVIIATKN